MKWQERKMNEALEFAQKLIGEIKKHDANQDQTMIFI